MTPHTKNPDSPLFFLTPEFNGKTANEIAYDLGFDNGTPAFEAQVRVLEHNGTEEYQDRVKRMFKAIIERVYKMKKKDPKNAGPISPSLIHEAEGEFYYKTAFSDWNVTEEDVTRAQPRYGPWNIHDADDAPWPTGRAFRFAQTRWEKSRWLMVPDFPSALLAMMGYKLHTPTRYMDDLTDDEIGELARLHHRSEVSGTVARMKEIGYEEAYLPAISDEEVARIKDLLTRCPFGGELPVFDVDSSGPKDPEKLTQEQLLEENLKLARIGAVIAKETDELWCEMTGGAAVQWTVTNSRGGLHGRHLTAPPSLRHPYLCIALEAEIKRRAAERQNLPILKKEGKDNRVEVRELRASLDLTSYHKYAGGHGGVWRAPGCKKDKPSSLPQTPVERYVSKMPWLDIITPSALGRLGPIRIGREAIKAILVICDEFQRVEEETAIASGLADRDPVTGRPKRKRATIMKPDLTLGTAEFVETAKAIRAAMPERGSGVSRHEVRMALAGWLIRSRVPTEAVTATLVASAGNPDDSRDAVQSTVAALRAGRHISGFKRLSDLVGEEKAGEIGDAFNTDLEIKRYHEEMELAESPDTMEIGLDPNEGPPSEISGDVPEETTAEAEKPKIAKPKDAASVPGAPVDDSEFWPYTAQHLILGSVRAELMSGRLWEAGSETDHETDAERIEREKKGEKPRDPYQLPRLALVLKGILKQIPLDKRWMLERVMTGTLALSAIGPKTVNRVLHAGGLGSLGGEVTALTWKIKTWRPGKAKPPVIFGWSFLKQAGVKHHQIVRLQEALAEDLEALHAPASVRRHCTLEQPWRSHERKLLADVSEGLNGFAQVDPNAVMAKIERVEKVVNDSAVLGVVFKGESLKVTVELMSLLSRCDPPYLLGGEQGKERPVIFQTPEEAQEAERAAAAAAKVRMDNLLMAKAQSDAMGIEWDGPSLVVSTEPALRPFVMSQPESLVGRTFGLKKEFASYKAIRDACRCMTVGHEMNCGLHGQQAVIFTRCKREVACPSCRTLFWDFINRWIRDMKSWPERVVVAKILPTPGEVPVDEHAQVEVEDDGDGDKTGGAPEKPADPEPEKPPEPAPMSTWLETPNVVASLPDGRRRYRLPDAAEQRRQVEAEKKDRLARYRAKLARARAKEPKEDKPKTSRRKTGAHMSSAPRDRLRHALQNDPGMRALTENKEINSTLGIRVWAGVDHGLVFMPASFARTKEDGTPYEDENGAPIMTDTMEYLAAVGAFQAPENELRVVSRNEACSVLLSLRDKIAESFDLLVLESTRIAHEVYRKDDEEAYRLKVRELGVALLEHDFVQPGMMRPMKHNHKSNETLPWFSDEEQAAFMKAKAEEEGWERDRCPVLVKKHETDLGCPCGRILETVTTVLRTGHVLLKNKNGYVPSREEAWAEFDRTGQKVGEFHERSYYGDTARTKVAVPA